MNLYPAVLALASAFFCVSAPAQAHGVPLRGAGFDGGALTVLLVGLLIALVTIGFLKEVK